jgi:hypothetical protein
MDSHLINLGLTEKDGKALKRPNYEPRYYPPECGSGEKC